MKIAIPMFHTKISPRFDQTQGFVLLETQNAGVVVRNNLETKGWSVIAKMKQLVDLEVEVLICGGIDRASLQYLSFNGIKIYSWVTGEVDDAVTCFLDNRMKPGIILGDKGRMKGRWQFCKGRNHLCNMFQTGFYKGEKRMIHILIVSGDRLSMSAFKAALDESDVQTTCLESGRKALSAVSEKVFDLLVTDENIGDMTGLELIGSVIARQPMLNCAAVSSLSPGDFHEASEGLGILMQLPVEAGKKEADQLLEQLNKIQSSVKSSEPREIP